MSGCGRLRCFAPSYACAAIDTDRNLTPDCRTADYPFLVAIVIDGAMLGSGIVPHRHVARIPAPAHRIFEPCDVGLQHFEQMVRIRLRITDEAADKMSEHERAFAGSWKDANDRVLGFVNRRGEHVLVLLDGCRGGLRPCRCVIVEVGMDRPETFRERLQGRRQPVIGRDLDRASSIAAMALSGKSPSSWTLS